MTKREFLDTVFALAPNEANAIIDAFDEYVDSNKKIDCDKTDKCEKLQLPPASSSEIPNSSDTISRQAAIDAINCVMVMKGIRSGKGITAEAVDCAKRIIADNIRQLPPIQPKKGKWIKDANRWMCDKCGELVMDDDHNFCPNCGADMREVTT